jgi:alcohol dehydrogenase
MQEFDYQLRPRILYGPGTLDRLGSLALEFQGRRVLVVSDPGVVNAGIFEKGRASLALSGFEVLGFHDLQENPTTAHVEKGLRVAEAFRPNLIVGLGGGSSMDCAKGINFIYSCGGQMRDYWGIGKATSAMLPMIAIPTTSGTGSETQSFALISDAETHVKMACGDPKAACRIAILDPTLTVTQPSTVTALTGIDALTHALETYVCNRSNPMSECFSRESWRLLSNAFARVLETPGDLEARGEMQLGACFAGMAIEASMLGAAHALANPLTASFGVPHGQAVGLMMPHVVRFNSSQVEARYAELLRLFVPTTLTSAPNQGQNESSAGSQIASLFQTWLSRAGLATSLSQLPQWPNHLSHDATALEATIDSLAASAQKQWTATFNPRVTSEKDMKGLYLAALEPTL